MTEIETPEQQRDEAPLACPVCGEMVEYESGAAIKLWNDDMREYRRRFLTADVAQQRVVELEKGIKDLLQFLDSIRCGLAMSHANATCVYYKELGEWVDRLTSPMGGNSDGREEGSAADSVSTR